MVGGKRLLSGAKQQPDEHPGHPRKGEMRQRLETSIGKLFFLLIILMSFFFQLWLRTQIGADIFWIGLNDQVVEGTWEWSDGTTYIEYLSYVIEAV